jgi:mono/diheme cytochrome c family protein
MRSVWLSATIVMSLAIGAAGSARAQLIDAGKDDYSKLCASCHGQSGKGDGPNAKGLIPTSQIPLPGNWAAACN